jgi:hypothetical protein
MFTKLLCEFLFKASMFVVSCDFLVTFLNGRYHCVGNIMCLGVAGGMMLG